LALVGLWLGIPLLVCGQSEAIPADMPFRSFAPPDIERRIEFYSKQTADQARLYPAWALLGKAYLDRVQWTGNPDDLALARSCVEKSIAIQANLEALLTGAAIANYGHRFELALSWCDRCAEAAPGHPEVVAMRVEALIALARLDEARQVIEDQAKLKEDAYVLGCRAMLLGALGDRAQALGEYQQAFQRAQAESLNELAVWSQVSAAGLCLDSGYAEEARPYLREAERLAPDAPDVIVHLAEFDEATNDLESSLNRYVALLGRRADPEVHRRASMICHQLGRTEEAQRHYGAAEQIWRAGLENGEVYPLEGLANLFCDSKTNLAEAVQRAEDNLRYKRDPSAIATRDRAQRLHSGTVR
jgi:tetratricopeptide (TPR) repeat protein